MREYYDGTMVLTYSIFYRIAKTKSRHADGMNYREDSNLKDVCHLAETIRRVCNLAIDDLSSIQSLSKQQIIEIVQLVEHELLSQPSIEPVKRNLVSDPLAIRVKQENQLIEELDKVGNEVLKKCPQIGSAIEDAVMKSLFMWHRCLNIDKVCRLRDAHGLILCGCPRQWLPFSSSKD